MDIIDCPSYVKKSYPLFLSYNTDISEILKLLPSSKKRVIIYDSVLERKFSSVIDLFRGEKDYIFPIEASEKNKSFGMLGLLLHKIQALNLSRDDIFIIIGGGLVLNLGGLTASLTMRGMKFYYIPTTLTAQIDASFGSKQAVNFNNAKNWVGMFNDPEFCYINPYFLATLSKRELNSQWIEGVKLALARDKDVFKNIYENLDNLYENKAHVLKNYLKDLIMLKTNILKTDLIEEKEGMSMLYGHTIGHAIEMLSHGILNHGEAVGIGMLCAAYISYYMGFCSQEVVEIHRNILEKLDLPVGIPSEISVEQIIKQLSYNKKNYQGNVRFVLLKEIGEMTRDQNGEYFTIVAKDILAKAINSCYTNTWTLQAKQLSLQVPIEE